MCQSIYRIVGVFMARFSLWFFVIFIYHGKNFASMIVVMTFYTLIFVHLSYTNEFQTVLFPRIYHVIKSPKVFTSGYVQTYDWKEWIIRSLIPKKNYSSIFSCSVTDFRFFCSIVIFDLLYRQYLDDDNMHWFLTI